MAKENLFWMQTGTAFYLGRNPKSRTGVALYKVPVVDVPKKLAARTEHIEDAWLWVGPYLCVLFRDPETGNIYAQPTGDKG
jgi:hypothetical protein